jgi:toxin ParE1/3/4
MSEVVFSPRAQADLDEIWEYTADRWDIQQADTYLRDLVLACSAVASGARKGRDAGDIRAGYFKITVVSHVVFYKERDGIMDVIRVLHQQMDMTRHLY